MSERDDGSGTPVMCTLTPDALAAGRADLLPGLAQRAATREQTAEGYRLTFQPSTEMLTAILRTIDAERQCCRWLQFDLAVSPDLGPFVLTLSGPPNGRELLAALVEAPAPSG
jgi:hypothetical protein